MTPVKTLELGNLDDIPVKWGSVYGNGPSGQLLGREVDIMDTLLPTPMSGVKCNLLLLRYLLVIGLS